MSKIIAFPRNDRRPTARDSRHLVDEDNWVDIAKRADSAHDLFSRIAKAAERPTLRPSAPIPFGQVSRRIAV